MRELKSYRVTLERVRIKPVEIRAYSADEAKRIVDCAQKAGAICWDEGFEYDSVSIKAEEIPDAFAEVPHQDRYVVVEYVRRGEIRNWWTFGTAHDAGLFQKATFEYDLARSKEPEDNFLKYGFWVGMFLMDCSITEDGWTPDMGRLMELDQTDAYGRCVNESEDGWDRDWTKEAQE